MTLVDRRRTRRYIGSGFDQTPVPPITVVVPPTSDPPGGPPILRGNVGQQVSAIVTAHNASGQELAGLVHIINSSNPAKVRVDSAAFGIITATILADDDVISLTGTIGGIAIPTIYVTGLTNSVFIIKMAGWWDADHVTIVGGNTTVLLDQTVNGNNLPAIVAAPAPVVVGGKNVLQPTGTQHYDLNPLSVLPTQNDVCIGSVAKSGTSGSDRIINEIFNISGDGGIAISADGDSTGKMGVYLRSFEWDQPPKATDTTARHFYFANRDGGITRIYRDGEPLLPIFGTAPHVGFTKATVFGIDHNFIGDWRLSFVGKSLTLAEVQSLTSSVCTAEGITNLLNPISPFNADDDFSVGATIDTAGTRKASATPWTAYNVGALINTISGDQLHLTLPQESVGVDFRGYTQPVITSGGSLVQIYRAKIIPANVGAIDKHRAMMFAYDTVSHRAYAIEVGYDSTGGNRQIRVGVYYNLPVGSTLGGEQHVGGFTAGDWNQEWTLWIAWNDGALSMWYQIGAGQKQFLYTDLAMAWFQGGGGTRPQLIGLGVSSQNAAGGDTIADFTDFAREY